ncbi:glycosyltransferase family 2 protein [Arthrobacter sp. CDRTa11]|uniref:glycosyltransferase family 2 protein n=1 Tax=Arthrobacter sp. CDRTa11 TaxID=2651199 RepID=UPI002265A595|nr:glycosyltransferase [Arthrobacter sp. CDRTa11]
MESITASTVTVGIITYKRPALLAELLNSLESQQRMAGFKILVVDNDPNGSGSEVVEASGCSVAYISEPTPGIVAARNAVLESLSSDCQWVIFVDDDETVDAGWFENLVGAANQFACDVVLGPVISVFEPDCPVWITKGGFIQRPSRSTGSTLRTAATNNVLIKLDALRKLPEPRFSEDFSLTGGSDAELFWRLNQSGARLVWCDEATVRESVPNSRANLKWIFRRTIRLGNVSGRLLQRSRPRLVVLLLGAGRIVVGFIRMIASMLTGRGFRDADFSHFAKGIGMVGACLGTIVVEYKRAS